MDTLHGWDEFSHRPEQNSSEQGGQAGKRVQLACWLQLFFFLCLCALLVTLLYPCHPHNRGCPDHLPREKPSTYANAGYDCTGQEKKMCLFRLFRTWMICKSVGEE